MKCGHVGIIGSYPGEGRAYCDLPADHKGDHEGTVSWERGMACETCPAETQSAHEEEK